jgi:cyanophycinase
MRRVLLTLLLLVPAGAAGQDADLILTGGRVWTGINGQPWAQAVAIRGEHILAIGERAAVERHRTATTQVIELDGAFVAPGFIDNHTHFDQAGALLLGVNLLDVADAAGLIRRVREARDRLPAGSWMLGGDWGAYEAWSMGGTGRGDAAGTRREYRPHRSSIDSLTAHHPVLLSRWDRSLYLANAQALELAGADCTWAGVECERDTPTGRLSPEAAARIRAVVPEKPLAQRLAEARLALGQLRELGVTTIHDITPPAQLRVFEELRRRGELTVRVNARPTLDKWDELAAVGVSHGFGDHWIRIGGLKGFTDGIMGNSTARFYEPYLTTGRRGDWRDSTNTGATSGPGSGMQPPGNMQRMIVGADAAGLWPHVHAIGDEAIDTLITLFETAIRVNGERDRRFRIIHTQVIRDAEVARRMAQLGIIAEVQPYHTIDDMRWMEERIGDRSRWAYAFRTLHDAGVLLSFGSDWPGTNASWYPASPVLGIYAAVTRQTLDGEPAAGWFPEERIDVETALRAYTVNNAWAAGEEAVKGQLAPGMLADIAVLDGDPFRVAPHELKDLQVLLTVVGGRIVHDARDRQTATAAGKAGTQAGGGNPSATPGRLVIIGGGLSRDNEQVYASILAGRQGDGPLCIIPTAGANPATAMDGPVANFDRWGGTGTARGVLVSAQVPATAYDAAISAEISGCSGFYFTGGVQSRILDAFRPGGQTTPAYQALLQRWQEGAVVAGSSAGAAMMSDPMIAGGSSAGAIAAGIRTAAAADRDDEGDASGGGVSIAPGMGLFQGGIVDQHFLARGRIGRLLVAVLGLDEFHHGFGIDENTALLADGSRVSVAGASAVVIVDASQAQRTGRGGTGIRLHLMSAGDSYDLNTRRLLIAADKAPLPVRDGTATATTTAHPDIFARWALLHLLHEFAGSSRAELVAPVEGGKLVLRKNAEFAARSRSGTGVEGTPEALTITGITVDLHLAEQRR